MGERVFVTGGAGFIGRAVVEHCLERGDEVMVFDCLLPQVHGGSQSPPEWLRELAENGRVDWWFGDVRQAPALLDAMRRFGPSMVIHLAAEVGVGQSQYQPAKYTSCNLGGTASLMECVVMHNHAVGEKDKLERVRAEVGALEEAHARAVAEVDDPYPAQDEGFEGDAEAWEDHVSAARQDAVKVIRHEVRQAQGALLFLEQLPDDPVERVFIAGSMSSYGEGSYLVETNRVAEADGSTSSTWAHVRGGDRGDEDLAAGRWDPVPPQLDRGLVLPAGVREIEPLRPASVYAWTKAEQEELAVMFGKAHGVDVVVGRFFNVYGPGQALNNPYTGAIAIFASRALNGEPPIVFEDGAQVRDMVFVDDVARAVMRICDDGAPYEAYNVGTGYPTSILELAKVVSEHAGGPSPLVSGHYRVGDIRSCIADTRKLRALGWSPQVALYDGLEKTVSWALEQAVEEGAVTDATPKALSEMVNHGLLRSVHDEE